jgi:hypothetical protein
LVAPRRSAQANICEVGSKEAIERLPPHTAIYLWRAERSSAAFAECWPCGLPVLTLRCSPSMRADFWVMRSEPRSLQMAKLADPLIGHAFRIALG